MLVYILVNEWCNATESGYNIQEVCATESDALQAMSTTYMDFIHLCDRNEVADFEDYEIDENENAVTIYSKKDSNLYEQFYVTSRQLF